MKKEKDETAEAARVQRPPAPNIVLKSQLGLMGEGLHPSHTLHHKRGIVWCWRCGSYVKATSRGLAKPCSEEGKQLGRGGQNNLKRLAKGQTPRADLEWPLGDEGLGEGRVHEG